MKFKQAKLLLMVCLLLLSMLLVSCGKYEYMWEVNSYQEFLQNIEVYNSKHDKTVDTFIALDLDDNEEVTHKAYAFQTMLSFSPRGGTPYDKNHDFPYEISMMFYLDSIDKSEEKIENQYKVVCTYTKIRFNFTADNKMSIVKTEDKFAHGGYYRGDLLQYEKTIYSHDKEEGINYDYHKELHLMIDDNIVMCIYVMSTNEINDEKLNKVSDFISDNIVVINTEG